MVDLDRALDRLGRTLDPLFDSSKIRGRRRQEHPFLAWLEKNRRESIEWKQSDLLRIWEEQNEYLTRATERMKTPKRELVATLAYLAILAAAGFASWKLAGLFPVQGLSN